MLNAQDLMGRTVHSSDGEKIGKAGQVFLDDQTNEPEWVTVNTGLFGSKETFVPIRDARQQGDDLVVPFGKDQVKGAPAFDVGDGHLSEADEDELYRYYGLGAGLGTDAALATERPLDADRELDAERAIDTDRAVGTDRTDGTDAAMTRSEERLRVGTERVETGRARLRKYVTTENVTQTVPVTRERVVVEREAITDANRGGALEGEAFTETEHEVVLSEERPVVAKETVPVERVRLGVEAETSQEAVSEELRKEQIEVSEPEHLETTRTERTDVSDVTDR